MKRILFFLLFVFSASAVFGQTVYLNPGISHSFLQWTNGFRTQKEYELPRQSYAFTAGIEFFERKNFSLSADLSLFESGGNTKPEKLHIPDSFRDYKDQNINRYISIGTAFNFNPVDKKVKLQIQFGPRIDFLTNAGDNYPEKYINNSSGLSLINYGVTSGLGLYYHINKIRVGASARYLFMYRKLADIAPEYSPQIYFRGVIASEDIFLFNFSLGYKLKETIKNQE